MLHTLKCPSCGAPVEYEDETEKRAFRCPFCNNAVVVPPELRRNAQTTHITFGFKGSEGRSSKTWLLVLLPVVGVFLIAGIIIAVIGSSLNRSTRNDDRIPKVVVPDIGSARPGASKKEPSGNSIVSFASKFGSEGTGPGYFKDARSIAVDGEGRIYVGEYSGGRIQVFDPSGKFITQWIANAETPMRSLAVDRKGAVYVAQRGEIKKYEGTTGQQTGSVSYAGGSGFDDVKILPDGSLLAAWVRAGRDDIVRLDPSGRPTLVLNKAISGQSRRAELDMRVAANGAGDIYALGTFNRAVFKFSPDGRYITRFGGDGDEAGQFRAPSAIAVDNQGRVYVTDFKGVQIFDGEGRYIDVFDVEGAASGLAFTDKNELYVVARTQVFKFNVK